MEPQTPQPQAPITNSPISSPSPSQNGGSSGSTQIDPTTLALSRSIRQVESNGNYNAIGDNGTSWGAYQWHGNNFHEWAQQYGLDPSDTSEQNQDEVAYKRIDGLLKQGLSQSEVAAIWNGANYSNGKYTAINPSYPQKVGRAYNQISAQMTGQSHGQYSPSDNGLGTFAQQANTATENPDTNDQTPSPSHGIISDLSNGNFGGAAVQAGKDVTNFALPIVRDLYHDIQGKSDKSILQQVGDLGMSALWFLPFGDIAEGLGAGVKALTGLGEAGAAADTIAGGEALAMGGKTATGAVQTPAITGLGKFGAKVASGAGVVGTGLVGGYLGDIASHASQGQTGSGILKPGLGTVLGGGLAGASLGAGALYNKFLGEQNVVDRVQQAYEDASGATKTGIKGVSKTAAKGLEPNAEFLANAGIPPETQEINGRRVFTTGSDSASQKTLQNRVTALTNLRDSGIAQSGASINLDTIKQSMLSQAEKDYSGSALISAKAQIEKELNAISIDPKFNLDQNGNLSAADVTKLKTYFKDQSDFDAATPSITRQVFRTMSNVTKNAVEDATSESGTPSVRGINKLIQQHLDAIDYLNKINGQTIKGGRLGKYLYEGVGATVGEGVGKALGGGLVSSIVGPVAGTMAGEQLSRFMQKLAVGGPMSAATLGRMATEDPEIVQEFLKYINQEGNKIAPNVQPLQKSSGGLIQGLLNKAPGSLISR